jgi:hypothetical protein
MATRHDGQPFLTKENIIELYINANNRMRHIHNALWKEEQHYTWLLYSLIAGVILTLTADFQKPWGGVIAIILSLIGMFVSLIGFLVLSRERCFFNQAITSCKAYAEKLGIVEDEGFYSKIPGISITNWFQTTLVVPIIIFIVLLFTAAFSMC